MQDYSTLKDHPIKEGTIREGTHKLLKDISHIYSDPISLKSTTFFANLTEILYTIFGDEKHSGWLERAYRDYTEADPNGNFRKYQAAENDLRNLVDLLSPSGIKNNFNLFTLMLQDLTESKYMLNESRLPTFTQALIANRAYDHYILQEYKKLFQHYQEPKGGSYRFDLILKPFEFYLFVFIHSMKKFQSKSIDPKKPEDFGSNNLFISLCTNPYLILLRRYLEFFLSDSTFSNQKAYFRKLNFLIEEYFIHDLIHSTPQTFSKVSPTNYSLSITNFYQSKSVKRQDFTSKKIPNPHIHYAIYLTLHYLQRILSPFNENSQVSHFLLGMPTEDAKSKYARLIYGYVINCLKYWTKDLNNPCHLADLGYVWLKYLRPWEVLPPNLIDELNNYDQPKSTHENMNQLIIMKDLKQKYQSVSSKERDLFYLSHKEYYNIVNNYIQRNLLFYTVLLKEFIITFCEVNNFNAKDINFFQECLELFFNYTDEKYKVNPYYQFLNGHVTFESLMNLSLGPKKRGDSREYIERHIEELGADYGDLYFINDEAIKMRVAKLTDKFNRYLTTVATSTKTQKEKFAPEIIKLKYSLERILVILHSAFDIGPGHQAGPSSPTVSSYRRKGIVKTYAYNSKIELSNPWVKPVGANDFFILYWIFYYLAKMFDKYIKGIPIIEVEGEMYKPSINLRGFSRKLNVYRFISVFFILYSLYYLLTISSI